MSASGWLLREPVRDDMRLLESDELNGIIDTVSKEHDELENHVVALASRFNEIANGIQDPGTEGQKEPEGTQAAQPKRRSRRKRGTELTLDD